MSSLAKSSRQAKRRRRRNRKFKRGRSYWQQHDQHTLSKVFMREVEQMWIEVNAPKTRIEVREVEHPELYRRYRTGQWDGRAVFLTFASAHDIASFKGQFWNTRF